MRRKFIEPIYLGSLVAIMLTSTYFAFDWFEYINSPNIIRVFNASDKEVKSVENRLDKIHYKTRHKLDMVIVVDSIHANYCGQCIRTAKLEQFIILVDRFSLANGTIWHEVGHAHFSTLPESAWDEWRAMPGRPQYFGDKWKQSISHGFPNAGIVTAYGSKSIEEDVACWVEAIYSKLNGEPTPLNYKFDNDNPIYSKILQWFLKWEFITEQQHKDIAKLILK